MKTIVACLVGAVACGGTGTGPDHNSQTPDAGTESQDPGGPRILSLAANRNVLTSEYDDLIISAVVTDEDGVEDLIGGQLFYEDGVNAFGAFATASQEGAYSITLDWRALTAHRTDLPGMWGQPVRVKMRAKFFDQAGHEASREISVELECSYPGYVKRVLDGTCDPGVQCGEALSESNPTNECKLYAEMTGTQACQLWNGSACVRCTLDFDPYGCDEVLQHAYCECN